MDNKTRNKIVKAINSLLRKQWSDKDAKKGCLVLDYKNQDLSKYSLTIDYQEDLDRCIKLLKRINKPITEVKLLDIITNLRYMKKINLHKRFKMPFGTTMKYSDYLHMQWNQGFNVTKKIKLR